LSENGTIYFYITDVDKSEHINIMGNKRKQSIASRRTLQVSKRTMSGYCFGVHVIYFFKK